MTEMGAAESFSLEIQSMIRSGRLDNYIREIAAACVKRRDILADISSGNAEARAKSEVTNYLFAEFAEGRRNLVVGNKIKAIKMWRNITGSGLAESKAAVEGIIQAVLQL